ncbi:MAG: TIGR03564 family F420-dependent LLM class oxidoreductase [Actinobacteria bacterium]|nr:TIGR03564 family F420-dependent LLM class oxidoreductase [Actinomycetota bacterium]
MKLSVIFPETRDLGRVVELAQGCEEAGLHGMWLGSAFGFDPVMALALAGPHTSRIQLGTSVVPTWPRHPVVMAQQAATANAACGGRFRLGIGPSHQPVMKMYGVDFDRPVGHVREYLQIVKALLRDGQASFKGERYRVTGFLDVEGGGTPPVMLAALHEQMCRTAGALADAALPWLAPPSYIADAVVPNVAKGAADAGREAPPVIASVPCVLSTNRDEVIEIVNRDLGIYPRMPFYADTLVRAGVPEADKGMTDGWTPAMIDAVIPWGDENQLATAAQAYLDAGADEIVLSPFGGTDTVWQVLGDIARG